MMSGSGPSASGLTTSMIPCCTCGTPILPNGSNQCGPCLASVDIGSIIRRGPGGSDLTIQQCRKCRRFDRSGEGRHYVRLDEESPGLMAILLKNIPALSSGRKGGSSALKRAGVDSVKVLDSTFIWTEPNSMRQRVAVTVKADIDDVSIQQRIKVEFIVRWRECPDCTRESRQRTWQAIVQLRQRRDDSRRGLLVLELAIARNGDVRRDILSVQTKRNGFDFYFPSLDKARHFVNYLQGVAPMRTKTTQSLVSADSKNNTANIKHTLNCDMVPLCRDDLIVVERKARGVGGLSGRLCLVLRVSSVVHLVDASPARDAEVSTRFADLHSDAYWRGGEEKSYRLFLSPKRLARFVVLDVELCDGGARSGHDGGGASAAKFALADVEVVRESDFGVTDETFRCVTHLGHLLNVGDVVLGYDLVSAVLSGTAESSSDGSFNSNFVMPDVVLVRKVRGDATSSAAGGRDSGEPIAEDESKRKKKGGKARSATSKKRDRRNRKEQLKQRRLAEAASRMGLDTDGNVDVGDEEDYFLDGDAFARAARERAGAEIGEEGGDGAATSRMDDGLRDDLELVERELANLAASSEGAIDQEEEE